MSGSVAATTALLSLARIRCRRNRGQPLATPALERRFAKEIESGRYWLVQFGIAESEGTKRFWVCDDEPGWSSFDRAFAGAVGARHHEVVVPTVTFGSLLERFGSPLYCKIDIEGSDQLCIDALNERTRPRFVSFEVTDFQAQVESLAGLGYRRFKIISQTDFRQRRRWAALLGARLDRSLVLGFRSLSSRLSARLPAARATRATGPSGPFGDDTHGQ